ncbi:hypothetical protein ACHAWF_009272 [Thalassiosira exigua]
MPTIMSDGNEEGDPAEMAGGGGDMSPDLDGTREGRRWMRKYGALILFFESKGHSNVPSSNQTLYEWATEQRAKFSQLSKGQKANLRRLNFQPSDGSRYTPVAVGRCSKVDCKKFAPFKGYCHAHEKRGKSMAGVVDGQLQLSRESNNESKAMTTMLSASAAEEEKREGKSNSGTTTVGKKGGAPSAENELSQQATAGQISEEQKSWSHYYGMALLFFEENGHTNVSSDVNRILHKWLEEQPNKVSELSDHQMRQLGMLNIRILGKPNQPLDVRRCNQEGCSKFATLIGQCHLHYNKNPAAHPPPPPVKTKTKGKERIKPSMPRPKFPLIGLRAMDNGKYRLEAKGRQSKNITRDEAIQMVIEFIPKLCTYHRETKCTCLTFLKDEPFVTEAVSHAILDFCDLSKPQRKHYLVGQYRYAEMGKSAGTKFKGNPIYTLPLSYDYFERCHRQDEAKESEDADDDIDSVSKKREMIGQAFQHRICRDAFQALHNLGETLHRSVKLYANGDVTSGQHGNAEKPWAGGRKFIDAYQSIRDKLNVVREEYRQYEEDGEILLPHGISRRYVYEAWVAERGWEITKKRNCKESGQYKPFDEWNVLPGFYKTEEEAIADGGDVRKVAKVVVSWNGLNRIWTDEFPDLKSRGRVGRGMYGGQYNFEKKQYEYS